MPETVRTLKLEHEAIFLGPNPFATGPVIVARISAAELDALASTAAWVRGCTALARLFPEWVNPPDPSPQHPVAQVARTAAHWSLGALNEIDGFLHDAGAVPAGTGACVWLGFHHPDVSISALKLAFRLAAYAARSERLDCRRFDSALESLWRSCHENHPDYQARILMQGARARDIPVLPFMTGNRFWQYGWGSRSRVFVETSSNTDGDLGRLLERSKVHSKMVFAELGIPTPDYRLVRKPGELPAAIEAVGWPCVVKPISTGSGRGVTAGIRTVAEAEAAFAVARRHSDELIMVEAFIPGDDHRLMVVEGRFFAAVRREPPSVTGDGRSSVAELISTLNRGRSRNKVKSRYRSTVMMDEVVEQHLQRQGVSVHTVLDAGRRIKLRGNANLSTGGASFDVTEQVHPHTKRMAEMIARAIGLATAGVDFITTDVGKPWHECGALIEVNFSPGASVLIAAGLEPIRVASAILGTRPSRIPVRLLVAPRSELPPVLHRLRNVPAVEGCGWVCGAEAVIGGIPLRTPGSRPWRAVEALLRHSSLQRACLVCSVEAMVRHGMPVDKVEDSVLYRCDSAPLSAAWMKVIADRSGTVNTYANWADVRLVEFLNAAHKGPSDPSRDES